jgi:hypothetical protein
VPAPPVPVWSLSSLKLPKAIEASPHAAALHAALRAQARPLWTGGALLVPTAPWSPAMASALQSVHGGGGLVRGLELIEKTLEREARGMQLADARSATSRGARVSRLMLLANDGTERFYRQAERLLTREGPRLLAIRVDADSARFASVVSEASGVVRALMLEHKDLVASLLTAMYPPQ